MQQEMHNDQSKQTCRNIIEHDSGTFWKSLQLSYRRRLDDIQRSEKYKTREESLPCEGNGDQRDELSGDLVDYDELRIFSAGGARDAGGRGDADERDQNGQGERG